MPGEAIVKVHFRAFPSIKDLESLLGLNDLETRLIEGIATNDLNGLFRSIAKITSLKHLEVSLKQVPNGSGDALRAR